MDRHVWAGQVCEQRFRFGQVLGRRKDAGCGIFQPQSKLLERSGELAGRVVSFGDFRRCGNQVLDTRFSQTAPEETVRIIDVTDDLLKTGEILAERAIKSSSGTKETSQRGVVDRARRVCVVAAFGENGNMTIAKDVESAVAKAFAKQPNCRQGKYEIAQRPAPD